MKICVFCIPGVTLGKYSLKDKRLDQVDALTKSQKKTPAQVELIPRESIADADAILASTDARADMILADLEFVETRLSRAEASDEKALLAKLKQILEHERLLWKEPFTPEERRLLSGWGLLTMHPVTFSDAWDAAEGSALLQQVLKESGHICFLTTGEKESRAWLIKDGTTAQKAAGEIHTDIERGFIRAEVIGIDDFLSCGGERGAKQAGKMRLEQKDYIVKDADVMMFRFNR